MGRRDGPPVCHCSVSPVAGGALGVTLLPALPGILPAVWVPASLEPVPVAPAAPALLRTPKAKPEPRRACPLKPLSCGGNKLPQIPVTQAENPGPLLIKPGGLDSVALATCTFFPILLFGLGPRLLYPAIMGPDSRDVYGVR